MVHPRSSCPRVMRSRAALHRSPPSAEALKAKVLLACSTAFLQLSLGYHAAQCVLHAKGSAGSRCFCMHAGCFPSQPGVYIVLQEHISLIAPMMWPVRGGQ